MRGFGLAQGAGDPRKYRLYRNAACSMGLRIEKQLDMAHLICQCSLNVRVCQIKKILFRL